MRFTSTRHNLLSKNHSDQPASNNHYRPARTTPLDIIELLELIFSFLDDNTINRSVAAVCRQWHHLNQHRLHRILWWDTRWALARSVESAVLKIPGSNRVRLGGAVGITDWRQIAYFLAALKKYDRNGQPPPRSPAWKRWLRGGGGGRETGKTNNRPTLYPHRPITELEIQCAPFKTREEARMDDLGLLTVRFPSTLTTLKIDIRQPFTLQMEYIFEDCPLLESLYIGGESTCRLDGTWVPLNHEPGRSSRLMTLVITNAMLDQQFLEDFLRITPKLSILRLIGLVKMILFGRTMTYDWSRLAHMLLQHISLTSCHFSIKGEMTPLDAYTRNRAIDMTPDATEWTLFPNEITPQLLRELTALPNVVTSLELLSPYLLHPESGYCDIHQHFVTADLLHSYLCQSPHLMHLKAIRSPVFINNLDICDRSQYGNLDLKALDLYTGKALNYVNNQYSTAPVRHHRPVWLCRGLRTLHMEIHGRAIGSGPVNSRIVFGYISLVCPVLEELVIVANCSKNWDPQLGWNHSIPLSLHLEGGLCLLTRLWALNTLTLIDKTKRDNLNRTSTFDLNWMAPCGQTHANAALRRINVAGWDSRLSTEQSMETLRSLFLADDIPPAAVLTNRNALQEIGLLSSVKRMVAEMDQEGNRIFPVLRTLSFGPELGLPPDMAIQCYFSQDK